MEKYLLSLLFLFLLNDVFSQQLPIGTCGIVYIHDAAGNRTRRVYFCNNGVDPYPQRNTQNSFAKSVTKEMLFTQKEMATMEVQEIESLHPNPTSGIFYMGFSKTLQNANISIVI